MNKVIKTEIAIAIIAIFALTILTGFFIIGRQAPHFSDSNRAIQKQKNIKALKTNDANIKESAKITEANTKEPEVKNTAKTEIKHKNGCDFIKNFETESWFKEMVTANQSSLGKPGDSETFYLDYSKLGRKQACLFADNFIFSPYEIADGSGPLFNYNITTKKLIEAKNDEKFFSDNFTDINENFASFDSGAGSGECSYENFGKYYYQENKVEIYKECNFCNKEKADANDCKVASTIYK